MFELVIVTRQAYQDALMNKGCLWIYGLKCPRIATHLEALGFDVLLVANEWFLGAFSKSLPLEVDQRSPSQTVSSPALSRVESLTSRSGTEQKAGLSCKHPKDRKMIAFQVSVHWSGWELKQYNINEAISRYFLEANERKVLA
ncbi:hypothetical protein ACET3Z_007508 [Daucus carota]